MKTERAHDDRDPRAAYDEGVTVNARTIPSDLQSAEDLNVEISRIPPHSAEAEAALLGGLLLDNGKWDIAGASLHSGHFTVPLHRMVFAAIARQLEAGK